MKDRATTVLWFIPILVTIHNLEESLLMRVALSKLVIRIPEQFHGFIPIITYQQFLIAVLVVTILPSLLMLIYWRYRIGILLLILLGFQMVMLINVLSHVAIALLLNSYFSGLITALVLNLPFSVYLFNRAIHQQWVSRQVVALLVPIALLVHGPGLMGLMEISGWVGSQL
ncbi:MAG: HXXEE domain-containing protein [Chloroflexota bacterium]